MRLRAVLAHAHDIVPRGRQLRIVVAEGARLGGAAGRIVLGIEIDDGFAARADEILRLHGVPVLVHDLEGRHLVSDFKHKCRC